MLPQSKAPKKRHVADYRHKKKKQVDYLDGTKQVFTLAKLGSFAKLSFL